MKAKVLAFRGPTNAGSGGLSVAFSSHIQAVSSQADGFGMAVKQMLIGWEAYAEAHRKRYGSGIGEDGVLGDHWERIGLELIGLLNGETGGLDCGSIDGNIREMLRAEGFSGEE